MTQTSKRAEFAGPIEFEGPAVEDDLRVKEKNDSEQSVESVWLSKADEIDSKLDKSEVEFFTELKQRIKDAS